jgi:hypothetical protein
VKVGPYQTEVSALKLLQERSEQIENSHDSLAKDLMALKAQLAELGAEDFSATAEFQALKTEHLQSMAGTEELADTGLDEIYSYARAQHGSAGLDEILSAEDRKAVDERIDRRIDDFNRRFALDRWDYAIAGSCGLFASLLDLLCVSAPPKPTVKWGQQVDGVFNQWVQKAFNSALPPELSKALGQLNLIGAPDSSVMNHLVDAPPKALNPMNHRLRSLAHDPVLGFVFGVLDMMKGTCTVVVNGEIKSIPSTKGPTEGSIFQLLGKMFGHLLSDVNAPSAKGNRGMGLPAPFMGLLRMFENIPVGDSNFGKQIEWMYIKGYDFRQFMVTSIPMAIMEVLLRVFYVVKQVALYKVPFADALLDTLPGKMNPRFRIMLALAYGTSSSINAGKMYITGNILNANYASWMGLAWNGFHALKWSVFDKHLKLWSEVEAKEIAEIQDFISSIDALSVRAEALPV